MEDMGSKKTAAKKKKIMRSKMRCILNPLENKRKWGEEGDLKRNGKTMGCV